MRGGEVEGLDHEPSSESEAKVEDVSESHSPREKIRNRKRDLPFVEAEKR